MVFIPDGSVPSAADYYGVKIGAFFFGELNSSDEVFMTLQAYSLTEETLGGVHVADHANQRRVRREFQFTAQYIGARRGE